MKFPLRTAAAHQSNADAKLVGASIVVWTTTPWTIPGNRAVSFSPRIEYGLYQVVDAPSGNWAATPDSLPKRDEGTDVVPDDVRDTDPPRRLPPDSPPPREGEPE